MTTTEKRILKLSSKLDKRGIDFAIIRQNADLFYFTGTVQDAHLIITKEGKAFFLVWRSFKRAKKESDLKHIYPLKGLSSLKDTLKNLDIAPPSTIGLEMDVLPTNLFLYYTQKIWPGVKTLDISPDIRSIRKNKDPFEIEEIKKACTQAENALKKVRTFLKEGLTELELSSLIEAELRKKGHPGLLRMRIWNQEMGMGQVVSGKNGTYPSWTNTPVGGVGPAAAFGMGASFKKIKKEEIISIDIGGWSQGYCCDITRPFIIGNALKKHKEVFKIVLELMHNLEEKMVPGQIAHDLYDYAINFMERAKLNDYFMGIKESRVPFIGHGLGIELDEYPFISKGNKMELEPGMVIALEPKVILPEIGVIGLEDTFVIEDKGARALTLFPRQLTII